MTETYLMRRAILLMTVIISASPLVCFAPGLQHKRKTGSIFKALTGPQSSEFTLAQLDTPLSLQELKLNPLATQSHVAPTTLPQEDGGSSIVRQTEVPSEAFVKQKVEERPALLSDMFTLPLELQQAEHEQDKSIEKTLDEISKPQDEEVFQFNFENADLQNFITQIEDIFNVSFISDDAISPLPEGSKQIKGSKITFHTNNPLTRKEAWNTFITFMQITGLSVVQTPKKDFYRLQTIDSARRSAVPAFIGVDYSQLPDSDEIVRYVYFIQNSTLEAIRDMLEKLRSSASSLVMLKENKAFILTDKSYNIKTLMKIIKELDQVSMPQSMSILKLRRADALQVKALYDSLVQTNTQQAPAPGRPARPRAQPSPMFFPENTAIIAEPRTNSLVLLGAKDDIEKIEEFIIKYVDVDLDQPASPLYVHQLQFADARTVADIMNQVTQFGKNTAAGQAGGVRGIDKYLRPISFVAEKATNRIVIKGDYDDYVRSKAIIEKLDEPQPQVAIEVLILSVNIEDIKELGTQLRSKVNGTNGLTGPNIKFQTSGLFEGGSPSKIVENTTGTGAERLLGNLLNLVGAAGPGNTLVTLGQDIFGVWGLFQVLQKITNLQVVSNPFLIATNKTKAEVSVGETRRVITGTIVGSTADSSVNSLGNDDADLTVTIEPQINSDGMIILDLKVSLTEFTSPDQTNGNKTTKEIVTKTIVADKEVLALGGLVRNTIENSLFKTPILGDIPLLGWLFKSKRKREAKENLLILLSTRIIKPDATADVNIFTQNRIRDYQGTLGALEDVSEKHDPIHKVFFKGSQASDKIVDDLLFERHTEQPKKETPAQRRRRLQKERLQKRNKINDQPADPPTTTEVKGTPQGPVIDPRYTTTVQGGFSLTENAITSSFNGVGKQAVPGVHS